MERCSIGLRSLAYSCQILLVLPFAPFKNRIDARLEKKRPKTMSIESMCDS